MVEVLGADIPVPSINLGFGTGSLIWMLLALVLIITGGVIFYLIYQWRIYNKKIVVFENVSGQGFIPVYKDKARLIRLGNGGEEILFLRKKKLYRTAYGRKMGKNTYWFAVGQDGYWYNIVLGDVDAKLGMLDIEPIDRDMRYMHVAIRKNIQDSYKDKKVLTATAIVVGGIIILALVMVIGGYFLFDQIAEVSRTVAGSVESAKQLQDITNQILSNLDRVCAGGSGLTPTT